tara:strand:+ start:18692 stop:19294 length:603 start_codon:yes stop_codon:yes gene_type:complete
MISVRSNIKQFKKGLKKIEKKQIPFATSRTLNDLAFQVRKANVTFIKKKYNNKTKWWTKSSTVGLEVKKSTKRNLTASVGFKKRNYFVKLHEDGGIKKSRSGANLAIPTNHARKARKYRMSGGAKLALQQPKTFIGKTRAGTTAIFQKKSKKVTRALYIFKRQVKIRKSLSFEARGRRIVNLNFKRTFAREFRKAMATAR